MTPKQLQAENLVLKRTLKLACQFLTDNFTDCEKCPTNKRGGDNMAKCKYNDVPGRCPAQMGKKCPPNVDQHCTINIATKYLKGVKK